jgi:hypothetical protein
MKISFYVEDGAEQIVLTPETEYEKKMLSALHDKKRVVEIKRGSFWECMGGYYRHTRDGDSSTMLVIKREPE